MTSDIRDCLPPVRPPRRPSVTLPAGSIDTHVHVFEPGYRHMTSDIRDCLPPVRTPRRPSVTLPAGSIDTHVHVFEPGYPLSPGRGYNPPHSTLADLKHLHATLGIDRVVLTQPSIYAASGDLST